MLLPVSDSCLIREHRIEIVDILATSDPTRQTLSVALFAQSILSKMEKQEILNETSAIKPADKLVGCVISRIDNPDYSEGIWKTLDKEEILNDMVKKIKSKREKKLELEIEMRKKTTMELEQMIGFRKTMIDELLDESKKVISLKETIEEKNKEINRMRELLVQVSSKSTNVTHTNQLDRLSMVLQRKDEIIEKMKDKLQTAQKQLTKTTVKSQRKLDTRLHAAAMNGKGSVVVDLLKSGANVDYKDDDGNAPLLTASSRGHTEVVQILLSNGASTEAKNNYDYTPLHTASYHSHTEVVQILLSNGASTEAKNNDGYTPLCTASSLGHTEVVQILLSNGASTEAKTIDGSTPLHTASYEGHTEVVQILLSNGASTEAKTISPLFVAIGMGSTDVAMLLISANANVFAEDKYGQSPALTATVTRNEKLIKCLMSNGVKQETIDKYRLSSDWTASCSYWKYDSRIIYQNKTTGKEQYNHPNLSPSQ